jgi:hypothetical protein
MLGEWQLLSVKVYCLLPDRLTGKTPFVSTVLKGMEEYREEYLYMLCFSNVWRNIEKTLSKNTRL